MLPATLPTTEPAAPATDAPTARTPPPRLPLLLLALCAVLVCAAVLAVGQGTALGALSSGDPPARAAPAILARGERFGWPLAPPHPVLRPFQPPSTPYGPGHRGVDLGALPGAPVFAADGGLVLYAGVLVDRSLVSVEHPGGLRTTYEPITPVVRVGQYVRRGELIGRLLAGHPGCPATAPVACLHWGAHRQREYLDPLRLVDQGTIRLLPWSTD